MTTQLDILGRPPARKPQVETEEQFEMSEDWRGSHLIRSQKTECELPIERLPYRSCKKVSDRRKLIHAMYSQGTPFSVIARDMNVTERTIYNDMSALGIKFKN